MSKTAEATAAEARVPPGKAPMGYAPLVEYARVRNPAGIPSTDADGQARLDVNAEVIWAQRGELLAIGLWRLAAGCKCDVPAKVTSL